MNVITWLDWIVLCQSFPLFNKYWRTQIPFYFLRACFFTWTLVKWQHLPTHFIYDFWTLAKQTGTGQILSRHIHWKLIFSRTRKYVHSAFHFWEKDRTLLCPSDKDEGTSVFSTCECNLGIPVSLFCCFCSYWLTTQCIKITTFSQLTFSVSSDININKLNAFNILLTWMIWSSLAWVEKAIYKLFSPMLWVTFKLTHTNSLLL